MNPKLSIAETLDWQLAWKIISDPSVFDRVCDDNWSKKPKHELQEIVKGIVENPDNYIVLALNCGEPVGVWFGYRINSDTLEVHTHLLASCRGRDAIQAGRMATQYILEKPDVEKMVSFCPDNMPEVYLFARYCGWHKAGMHTKKWLKNGVEYALRIVEATKKDLILCPSH